MQSVRSGGEVDTQIPGSQVQRARKPAIQSTSPVIVPHVDGSTFGQRRYGKQVVLTSAALSFFDSIAIGDLGEVFVDGATDVNNPAGEVGMRRKTCGRISHLKKTPSA